jgi:hypothetical protein
VGLGAWLGSKTVEDAVGRELLDRIGRRVGYAGVAFAVAGIANEGFTPRTTADLIFSGVGLIPTPYTEIPAAIYTVGTVYYDLEHLRSQPLPLPSPGSPPKP